MGAAHDSIVMAGAGQLRDEVAQLTPDVGEALRRHMGLGAPECAPDAGYDAEVIARITEIAGETRSEVAVWSGAPPLAITVPVKLVDVFPLAPPGDSRRLAQVLRGQLGAWVEARELCVQ